MNYRCKWVKIQGDEYKVSAGVILNVMDDLPTVGIIQNIYIVNGDIWTSLSSLHITMQLFFQNCLPLWFVHSYT